MDNEGTGGAGALSSGSVSTDSKQSADTHDDMLQQMGAEVAQTSILAQHTRALWFFAYDELLSQSAISRFTKGMHQGKIVSLPNFKLIWPFYYPPVDTSLSSLLRTNLEEDSVWGWLYDARNVDFTSLDRHRRIPTRYRRVQIHVHDRGGRRIPAFTYVLTQMDEAPQLPSANYREQLVTGAIERSLPEAWIQRLREIPVVG